MSEANKISQGRIFRHGGRPSLIGHRGFGSGVRNGQTENSVSSVLAASEAGADWVEVDIRRTADDQLLLHHDGMIEGHVIAELNADDPHLENLTTFDEFLTGVPSQVGLDIEIKPDLVDALKPKSTVDLMVDIFRDHAVDNPTIFTSFDTGSLHQVRSHLPNAAIGFLTWMRYPLEFAVITAAQLNAEAVCVHVTSLGTQDSSPAKRTEIARALSMCEELNIDLMVWGAKPDDVPRLLDLGVDALTVDHVRETRRLIDAAASSSS